MGGKLPPQTPQLPPKKREKERREGEREKGEEKRRGKRERGRGSDGEMQTERITAIIIIETQITLVLYRISLRGFLFFPMSYNISGPSIVLTFHHVTLKDL